MSVRLTTRMQNWINRFGAHIATADSSGFPSVIVAEKCTVHERKIIIPLNQKQLSQIEGNIRSNPQIALAPGHLGAIRAPYQIKGQGVIAGDVLELQVTEIYCTKPGDEAGLRLDVLGIEKMNAFDQNRWPDIDPPQ